jgi:hypothetical protein
MTIKLLSVLVGILIALLSLSVSVEAYGLYSYGGYSNYPYRESTDFYGQFERDRYVNNFLGSSSLFSQNSGSQFSNYNQNTFGLNTDGFLNQNTQNLFEQSNINLQDGFQFSKGPCVTEKVHGNFRGKDNDFTLTREVCDNIEGTFFKDNNIGSQFSNTANVNNVNFGAQLNQNQLTNQNTNSQSFSNEQTNTQTQNILQHDLSVSFGKGTRIVLN